MRQRGNLARPVTRLAAWLGGVNEGRARLYSRTGYVRAQQACALNMHLRLHWQLLRRERLKGWLLFGGLDVWTASANVPRHLPEPCLA